MNLFNYQIILFIIYYFKLNQVSTAIVAHDLTCPVTNKRYLKDVSVYLHADSVSNEFFANLTIIKSFPQNSTGHMRVIKRSLEGKYEERTHMIFSQRFCDSILNPINPYWSVIHKRFFKECPAPPGIYGIARFALIDRDNQKIFQTALDREKYLIIFYLTHGTQVIYYCHVYFDVN